MQLFSCNEFIKEQVALNKSSLLIKIQKSNIQTSTTIYKDI